VLKVLARSVFATATMAVITCPSSFGQLPPTNMGKYVHQPGDNQYSTQTQSERHAPPPQMVVTPQPQQGGGGGAPAYHPVKAPPRPDYSIMPITCDEPIKPPGFPPLPDRLDFSNVIGSSRFGDQGSGLHFSSGGGDGAGGNTVGNTNGAYVPPKPTGVHQHYTHYDAGAFIPPQARQEQSHSGYYKVTTPRTDYYNANNNPDDGAPKFHSDAGQQLKNMGPQPRLAPDQPAQASAPTPVTVNQAVTQDLSLPDDQTSSGQALNQNNMAKRFARRTGQVLTNTLNNAAMTAASQAQSAASMAGMSLHY
jgi:hypothetical protein